MHVFIVMEVKKMLRKAYLPIVLAVLLAVLLQPAAALATSSAVPGAAPVGSSDEELASATSKWIDVNLSRQRLTAYVGNRAVYSTLVSTGTSAHPTPTGTFRILDKLRYKSMTGPGYYLPNVPYTMHFRGGYAIHGTYWHHNFGHVMSHGCVNLPTSAAAWVYYWAPVGTRVYIHY
jgi:hypothetical protein